MKFLFHVFWFVCFVLLESSDRDAETPNAFIFSLNNFEGLAPFVSKVRKENTAQAIYRGSDTGPVFGNDLTIDLNHMIVDALLGTYYSAPPAVKDRYTVLAGTRLFSLDEVEVFFLDTSR